ncbi:DUF4232 domain-containing protein [Corynebacterium renale]|uniref:Uncharacterized protein DUF4232 n=1 Tax=Corynebacterium renale TaxID=1724 RepID=A0A2A9DQ53_9CORY|nr:DUF4232 domain-containing protein [Corynebacterium renale]PFG28486.1 uncharacterized protein DUF4232 [Corynebacterium renale]SQI26332.1 Uncharacterised protein [Corynebacterium renale]
MRQIFPALLCIPLLTACGAATGPENAPIGSTTTVTTAATTTHTATPGPFPAATPTADYAWPARPEDDGVPSCPAEILSSSLSAFDTHDDGGFYTITVSNTSDATWCGVKDFPKLRALSGGTQVGRMAHINGLIPETIPLAAGESAYAHFELRGGKPCSAEAKTVDSINMQWPREDTMPLPEPLPVCTDSHQVPPVFITGPWGSAPTPYS